MQVTPQVGRLLIAAGIVLVVAGILFLYAKPLRLGALPGDITVAGRTWQVSILLGTSLLLSLVLTLVLNLLLRRR
ncbi:MAG TPA: DUF2905 family protein [Vicinamibacterales bacterium]